MMDILPPDDSTTIATVRDVVRRLAKRFPKAATDILEWADSYQRVLGHLGPAELAATFNRVVDTWDKPGYPRPAAFSERIRAAHSLERHPLHVEPPRPFPLSDREFTEWQRQNGELFLMRLGYWKHMRVWLGDQPAADALKQAQDDDQAYRLFDQYRNRETLDINRPPPRDDAVQARSMAEMRDTLAAIGRKSAILKGDDAREPYQPSDRMRDRMRGLADAYRARAPQREPEPLI